MNRREEGRRGVEVGWEEIFRSSAEAELAGFEDDRTGGGKDGGVKSRAGLRTGREGGV